LAEGLISALNKLGGDAEVLEVANRATAGLYFVYPIKKFEKRASSIFCTHPPHGGCCVLSVLYVIVTPRVQNVWFH